MRIKLVYFVIQINLKKFDPRKYAQNMIEIIKSYFALHFGLYGIGMIQNMQLTYIPGYSDLLCIRCSRSACDLAFQMFDELEKDESLNLNFSYKSKFFSERTLAKSYPLNTTVN